MSDRTPGRARLSAGCRPIGSRDRTKAAPESCLLDEVPRAQRTGGGQARSRSRFIRLNNRRGANGRFEVPFGDRARCSRSCPRPASARARPVPMPQPSRLNHDMQHSGHEGAPFPHTPAQWLDQRLLRAGITYRRNWPADSTTSGWLERDAKLRDGQLAHP